MNFQCADFRTMHYNHSEVDSKSKYNVWYDLGVRAEMLKLSERCVQVVGKFSV